jgi:E3 ubiquitin-protein ligase RNF38/44
MILPNLLRSAGRFTHSGATEMVNGGFHEYQTGPSTVCQGPVPYFHQHAMHAMQAHNMLDHAQMQLPYQQCHSNGVLHGGVNYSVNCLHLGPRVPVLFTNSERAFGLPQHPFLANPVNHQNISILQSEVTSSYFGALLATCLNFSTHVYKMPHRC